MVYPNPYPNPYPPQPPVRKWYQKKRFLIPIGLLVLLILFGSCSGNRTAPVSSTPGTATSPASAPTSAAGAAAPASDQLKYGQTYSADGLQLTVSAPKAGDSTIEATYCTSVSYVNGSDSVKSFNLFDWKVVDTDGVEVDATIFGSKNILSSGDLRPGGKKAGDVCFQKQGAGTPQGILYRGGLFSGPITWS